jgi:RNA polymerase sigma factor (sigma-70 family)
MDPRAELERLHLASFGWAVACCRGRRREAEDVLQTVYLRVLDGRARFKGRSSFRTWLFAVIRRTSIEVRRQRWLREALLERWYRGVAEERVVAPSSEGTLGELDRKRELQAALSRLSRRQREVLQLSFYHDMTLEEVAQTLRIGLGSARTHFERGKARLRELLPAQGT